jgi:hypothetical protein
MRAATMTSSYGDKEREFLEALEGDTGQTLAQWMEAIAAQGLSERNDIIDWLRRQGFRFSRASWLERVYHNGGKPIYADRPQAGRRVERRPSRPGPAASAGALGSRPAAVEPSKADGGRSPAQAPDGPGVDRESPRPAAEAYASAAANVVALTFADPLSPQITELTAKAKAYRPLADYILREIAKAVPGTTFGLRGQLVAMVRGGREFATLAVSVRELKLAVAGTTVALTDARQVDAALITRVRAAAGS